MRSTTHAEYLAMRRLPALDGLRAVAAVIVVTAHFGGPKWAWLSGWLGVHLFFVLSGYLITTLALREEDRKGKVSLRDFYLRRIFRIFPAYYFVLFFTVGLAWVNNAYELYGPRMPLYLTFNNEFADPGAFSHTWTLGIEQKFYLVWPVLAFVVARASFSRRLGVTVAALIAFPIIVAFFQPNPNGSWAVHYIAILLGCLVAILLHHPRGWRIFQPLTHPIVSVVVCVLFIAVHLSVHPAMQWMTENGFTFLQQYKIVFALYGIPVALLIPALLGNGPGRWLMSNKVMVFIGERSYSLYLVQYIGHAVAVGLVPALIAYGTTTWVVATVVSLLLADLIYRYIEQPMIKLGRRVVDRKKKTEPAPVEPAAEEERERAPARV